MYQFLSQNLSKLPHSLQEKKFSPNLVYSSLFQLYYNSLSCLYTFRALHVLFCIISSLNSTCNKSPHP